MCSFITLQIKIFKRRLPFYFVFTVVYRNTGNTVLCQPFKGLVNKKGRGGIRPEQKGIIFLEVKII